MPAKNKKPRVLVCLSGGVDSAVAAALLIKQGFAVTAAFMVNYHGNVGTNLCWKYDYRDAVRVAAHLGIPIVRLDFSAEYKKLVLDYMFSEYKLGRTPNPDILCNEFIKFGVWLEWALKNGFDYLATGHYANVRNTRRAEDRFSASRRAKLYENTKIRNWFDLLSAKDKNKDQTYFLHRLNQEQLAHTLFPIGNLLKSEVRKLARQFKLPNAEREESMGICFVGEVPMKDFLQKKIKIKTGKIIFGENEVVGEHDGVAFYTIGERVSGQIKKNKEQRTNDKLLFVVDKDIAKNLLYVGFEDDVRLYKKEIRLTDGHFINRQLLVFPLKCQVRLRHRQPLQNATLFVKEQMTKNKLLAVNLPCRQAGYWLLTSKPQRAPTPGQFAVVYLEGICLGGGVIQ